MECGESKILIKCLREYMLENRKTRAEIAKQLNVSVMTISRWFNGKGISDSHAYRISALCEKQIGEKWKAMQAEQEQLVADGLAKSPDIEKYKSRLIAAIAMADFEPETRNKVLSIVLSTD